MTEVALPLDQALVTEYDSGHLAERWLLAQSILSGAARRDLASRVAPGGRRRFLDMGTGFGALALEVACAWEGVDVWGVDHSLELLAAAQRLHSRTQPHFALGASVRWVPADCEGLPFASESFDSVSCQLVFQHLSSPQKAALEIARVLSPDGRAFVIDVDDDLELHSPPLSPTELALSDALRRAQEQSGGDRRVGRKIAGMLEQAGLVVEQIELITRAGYATEHPLSHSLTLARFARAKDQVVRLGLMDEAHYDALMRTFASEEAARRFSVASQVLVVASKGTR